MDKFFAANGGFLRKVDFEKHTSTWDEPISTNYRGYDVYELPPNGQGLAALQMLNILEGFDLKAMGYNSPQALHADDRSEEAGVRRSREILRGPGVRESAGGGVALEKIRRGTAEIDRSEDAPRNATMPAIPRSKTATRFTSPRPTKTATW